MLKKLKYCIKRFINCVDAPNRSKSFEEWTWLELKRMLENKSINYKSIILYLNYHEVFNSIDLYYYKYWGKNNKYTISKEVLEYTLIYIEEKVKKNKNLILEKSEEYIIIKKN